MTAVFMLLLALGAVASAYLAIYALRRNPSLGFFITAAYVLVVWDFPDPIPLLSVAGISVQLTDVIMGLFLAVALLNVSTLRRNLGNTGVLLGLLGILLTASLLRGAVTYGAGTAFNEARSFLTFFGCLLWALSLNWRSPKLHIALLRTAMWGGWALTALAGYHAMKYGIGGAADYFTTTTDGLQTGRVLVAVQALFLGLCSFVCMRHWLTTRRSLFFISGLVFAVVLVLSQQRSVWAAMLIATAIVFVRMKTRSKVVSVAAALLVSVPAGLYLASAASSQTLANITSSAKNMDTYGARTSGWQILVDRAVTDGPGTVLFGAPFGSGYERLEPNGLVVEFQPHNIYVSLFLRMGVIGLGLYLLVLFAALARILKASDNGLALGLLVAVAVFGWAYGPMWLLHIFFAFGLVGAERKNDPILSESRRSAERPAYALRGRAQAPAVALHRAVT